MHHHPAHHLLDSLESLRRRHPCARLTFRWVLGNRNIKGNERADMEAKRAAQKEGSPLADLPAWLAATPLPANLSKVRQALNELFLKVAQ